MSIRVSMIGLTLSALLVGTAASLPLPQSAGSTPVEIRFNGGVWRGQVGDSVDVVFVEVGREQTASGTVVKADKYTITVEMVAAGKTTKKIIPLGDIKSVKARAGASAPATPVGDASAKPGDAPAATPQASPDAGGKPDKVLEVADNAGPITGPRADGKKTVFILPLHGMVGTNLRHEEMDRLEKEADKLGPGQIIIMRINSGGGLVSEGDMIHESLMRIKKKHRLVAWIEEAISGAAFTALHADEIYFMDVGSLGAITMFAGATSAQGRQLEAWLEKVFEVGEQGGRYGHIIRCMVYSPLLLSYDKDEKTGKVTWHDDLSGQYILSDEKDNLVFNATNAVHSNFAQGRANTEADLFKVMQLEDGTYVVSDAGKKFAADWDRTRSECLKEVPSLAQDIQIGKGKSQGTEAVISNRISALKKLIAWWDRAPNIMAVELNAPPKERFEEQLIRLKKELADMQKQNQKAKKQG